MLFLDDQWFDVMARQTREQLNRPGLINATYCEVFTDCPGDKDTIWIFAVVRDGILQDIFRGEGKECIPDADLCCTGTYADHAAMIRGELDRKSAMLTGRLKVKGKWMKIIKLIFLYGAFTEGKNVPDTLYGSASV